MVFDLHTWNHHRACPDGPVADAEGYPDVNLGTGTIDRGRWGPVLEGFLEGLSAADRQLYAPRTMRRCQLGIILFIGVGGVDGWKVLPALVC